MKKLIFLLLLYTVLSSCGETVNETVAVTEESTAEVTILTVPEVTAEEVTTVITTEETTVETTAVTTTEATTVETTAVTTAATTAAPAAETTAATTAKPAPERSNHVPSVLDGEYTFGGEPVIETVDGFTYVNGILIINKTYSVPKDFNPKELHPDAKAAFDLMKSDAAAEGITLKIISGFRPYSQQESTYNNYSKRDGKELADRYSARPGHSEHQSGLAMDINSLRQSFGETKEGLWLANHAADYGFIIRYGKDKESFTGFMHEPWHIRYLGTNLAKAVTESGLSLEEYLGITSVYPD
ncbi:MAG: M15 family metallopeptidase [Clostridia bacterium]|nr:M15 family metallopeptidase [Clostridia bacterium]